MFARQSIDGGSRQSLTCPVANGAVFFSRHRRAGIPRIFAE
jgi:hypothetical protein